MKGGGAGDGREKREKDEVEDEEEEEEEDVVHRALMDGSLLALASTPRIAAAASTEDASLTSARDVKQEREHAARRQ